MKTITKPRYYSVRKAEPCEFGGVDGYHWNIADRETDERIAIVYSAKDAALIVKALNK
jgi:hypothetical protein